MIHKISLFLESGGLLENGKAKAAVRTSGTLNSIPLHTYNRIAPT